LVETTDKSDKSKTFTNKNTKDLYIGTSTWRDAIIKEYDEKEATYLQENPRSISEEEFRRDRAMWVKEQ
jgi:hypothetical protein